MGVQKLPSGKWRAKVWRDGKAVSVASVIGGPKSYANKREARTAVVKAQMVLSGEYGQILTVSEWFERWTTDDLFRRPKATTNLHNAERVKAFVAAHESVPLRLVTDATVAEWLRGGSRNAQVPALRAMFNDAASAKAGRLIDRNPFAGLGIAKTKGNKKRQPPNVETCQQILEAARELTPPTFADWLEFACTTGARPSEVDALRRDWIDLGVGEAELREQWSAKIGRFDAPKYGSYTVAIPQGTVDMLKAAWRRAPEGEFAFETIRETHYTPSARSHHWNRVRCSVGLPDLTLYLATRHYFGWYALNVLELPPYIIAEQLGHKDGGKLVTTLYGHPDGARARRRIREAFA